MGKKMIPKALIILGAAIVTGVTTVGAAAVYQTVNAVLRPDIVVKLDDKAIDLKDSNGESITPVIINGSTYLPIRAVASSTGLNVDWDEKTGTIYLRQKSITSDQNEKVGVRGTVKNIVNGKDGITFLVEGKKEDDTQYDKATVTANRNTTILKDGNNTSMVFNYTEIKQGDIVEVKFKDDVSMSYPVLAVADTIKIIESKDSGNSAPDDKYSFDYYLSLIGMSKEKVTDTLGEKPVTIDEGGLMFEKAGIRVWFKDYGNGQVVDQIFTQRSDIDFNNAKIGDNISSFKEALGEPVSDKNSDAHFKYKGIFLSVQYDQETGKTFAAYILKNDF